MKSTYPEIEDKEVIDNIRLSTVTGASNVVLLCAATIILVSPSWPEFHTALVCSLVALLPVVNLLSLLYYKRFRNINGVFLRFCILDALILTTILHYTGDFKAPLVFIYIMPIIMAAPIFPLKRIIALIVIYAGFDIGLITLEELGVIPTIHTPGIDMVKEYFWLVSSVGLILMVAIGIIIAKAITSRREKEYELAATNEKLQSAYEDLKKAQEHLIQSEKMASVGLLAAGVAHEINNPLNIISMSAQYLQKKTPPDDPKREYLATMVENIARAHKITRVLLDYSRRPPEPKMKAVDLNRVIDEAFLLVERTVVFQEIEVSKDMAKDLPPVLADEGRLKEVFINLITNAREAMPTGGLLTLATNLTDGGFIEIRIQDTGCGVSEEDLRKIYDPFFSTKEQGTGLGLSIVQGIIKEHNGRIGVESQVGKGTSFIVELPATAELQLQMTQNG